MIYFIDAICHRMLYDIDFQSYIDNKLFKKNESYKKYMQKNHKIIHKWKNVVKIYAKDTNFLKRVCYRIDYLISKLLYPGLDAIDYFRYEFYNFRYCKRKTFITEGELRKLNEHFNQEKNNMELVKILQDKELFNEKFSEFIGRKWLAIRKKTYREFEEFCVGLDKVICKPLQGSQGQGIFIASVVTDEDKVNLYESLHTKDYLIEEIINQNEIISEICPESVNTIRIYSVVTNDEKIEITGAVLRVGSGLSAIDNYSSGGLAATVDVDTGIIISRAITQNGIGSFVHPKTGKKIIGVQIPNWDEVKNTIVKAHQKISKLRYIGWDVVVCNDMRVLLIEGNTYAGVALQQHPMLSGKRELYKKLY